jgi:3-methyladenine DNA glycosylase AlkD
MAGLDVAAACTELDAALRAAGTPERAEQERRYLKSDLRHYGATMPVINRVTRAFSKAHPELTREDLRALVEALWEPGVHELRMTAVELMTLRVALLDPTGDLPWLEPLLRTSRTWALVDPLAAEVVGPLADRAPDGARPLLDRWAADEDHWMRRSVLLRHLLPLRRGERDAFAPFAGYADGMLEEKEFFIRKAIGWVLREYGKRQPAEVAAWLESRLSRMAGLTVREAIKHLPGADRERLSAAYKGANDKGARR